jgi:hypothetical protein
MILVIHHLAELAAKKWLRNTAGPRRGLAIPRQAKIQ